MERYDIMVNVWGDVSGPQYEWETVKAEDGDFVLYTDAQATVEAAKAEGADEVRKVIHQRLIDVRLARSVTRLSFAQDEYAAQISVLESILKQCEEPFSSNNENGPDLQATVEALQRERDTLREATKVICGHCCEPMAIPSKAVLQSQLSALQGLVRAMRMKGGDGE